ncbi:MAG TPA: DEAD/DEAH box helicase [Abditibacterium sp.]|jgi:ATP-dependent RNA helicase RhlE
MNTVQSPVDISTAMPSGVAAETVSAPSPRFHDLNLAPAVLETLDKLGFVTPTPIQYAAIPPVMEGRDIIGIAQTGTGKTLAFGLPMLHRLALKKSSGRALILLPTRELALQVEESLANVGRAFRVKTAVLIGGAPIRPQLMQLRQNPDIIVATPGRLMDHLQNGAVDLRTVDTVVLDEADRMLDMGFAPQIKQIMRGVPTERQTLLFSATMPEPIAQMAREFMKNPARIEIEKPGTSASGVTQELFVVAQEQKSDLLAKLLYEYSGSILVFARTRSRARKVARDISRWDIRSAEIHADRTLAQRRAALDGFKDGRFRVLVATDIAARGIDVNGIEVVINYDLPDSADDYVHRIGRTGRAGKTGHAISFAAPDQSRDVRDIERTTGLPLAVSPKSEGVFDAPTRSSSNSGSKRGNGGRPRNPMGNSSGPRSASGPRNPSGPRRSSYSSGAR